MVTVVRRVSGLVRTRRAEQWWQGNRQDNRVMTNRLNGRFASGYLFVFVVSQEMMTTRIGMEGSGMEGAADEGYKQCAVAVQSSRMEAGRCDCKSRKGRIGEKRRERKESGRRRRCAQRSRQQRMMSFFHIKTSASSREKALVPSKDPVGVAVL